MARTPTFGQGVKRVSEALGETDYAFHCKGLELPAYLLETNPGYPFAVAGGHMSMRTFLLLIFEGRTDLDYWTEAITQRGLYQIRDDLLGLCKFAGLSDALAADAINDVMGTRLAPADLKGAVLRTLLRAYASERRQGMADPDYDLPALAHERNPHVRTPHFVTRAFMDELRRRVLGQFDAWVEELGVGAEARA